jgi:UDP-4-amino-4,6-dideoxy-L-N-acetyl-beta-L-altrosamine transaminase
MIDLFHIPNYRIDTSKFSNLLHDNIVTEFEQEFAEYVGAKYACSANSASSLLYLSLAGGRDSVRIPSTIPPVVPNVICNSENFIDYYDDIDWVGHYYKLHTRKYDNGESINIYDSAQQVTRNQFKYIHPGDVMIFSFYPTKPVGSCDGGMIVSDDKEIIEWYKVMTMNGTQSNEYNNWERTTVRSGYKFHANSIQMGIASNNLRKLDAKNERLDEVKDVYNKAFGLSNTSRHLYRIRVKDNIEFIKQMKEQGIVCGIHYKCCHLLQCHGVHYNKGSLPLSEQEEKQTVSIPFHEKLTSYELEKVIINVKKLASV